MSKSCERFELTPAASMSAKFYHCLSLALLFFLVLAMPVMPIFQLLLFVMVVIYAWFAWPSLSPISFDARLNGSEGNMRLVSAVHLLIGWRLQLKGETRTQVIWFFDDQFSRHELRVLSMASHLEQLKRQASI